jgi:hypothetical protein
VRAVTTQLCPNILLSKLPPVLTSYTACRVLPPLTYLLGRGGGGDLPQLPSYLLVAGDWNTVPDVNADVCGMPHYNNSGKGAMERWRVGTGTVDVWRQIKAEEGGFSRRGVNSQGNRTASRLDRWYLDHAATSVTKGVDLALCPHSDHDALVLSLSGEKGPKHQKRFYVTRNLVRSAAGTQLICEAAREMTVRSSSFVSKAECWVATKARLQEVLEEEARVQGLARLGERTALQREYDDLGTSDDTASSARRFEVEAQLLAAHIQQAEAAAARSNAHYVRQGERSTSYFLGVKATSAKRKAVARLRTSLGTTIEDEESIEEEFESFWSDVFTSDVKDAEHTATERARASLLAGCKLRLSPAQVATLERPLSLDEATPRLMKMNEQSSPGTDGLTCAVYKAAWHLLGPLWLAMVEEALEDDFLPDKVGHGSVVMLPKKEEGVLVGAGDFRPITLLNADYKLLASILAARLKFVAPDLVDGWQAGFTDGRYIGDNVILIRDYIEWLRQGSSKPKAGSVVFLDFAKAFDRVEWSWLRRVLQHYGMGPNIIAMIMLCYSNAQVKLLINGRLSGDIVQTRGVRQGCPLSPVLFVLSVEPLQRALRDKEGLGRWVRGALPPKVPGRPRDDRLVAALFADDITLFPENDTDLHHMLSVVEVYGQASGAKLNRQKSLALRIGDAHPPPSMSGIPTVGEGEGVKSLGLTYGPSMFLHHGWWAVVEKMRAILRAQLKRHLSVWGKVAIANSLIASMASYLAAFVQPSAEQMAEMDRIIYAMVWGKDPNDHPIIRGVVNKVVAKRHKNEGGVGAIIVSDMVQAFQCKIVNRALSRGGARWTVFFEWWADKWAGKRGSGLVGLLAPSLPTATPSSPNWLHAVRAWRLLNWRPKPATELTHDALLAMPLFVGVAREAAGHCAAHNSVGVTTLAAAGLFTIGSIWERGWRCWGRVEDVVEGGGDIVPGLARLLEGGGGKRQATALIPKLQAGLAWGESRLPSCGEEEQDWDFRPLPSASTAPAQRTTAAWYKQLQLPPRAPDPGTWWAEPGKERTEDADPHPAFTGKVVSSSPCTHQELYATAEWGGFHVLVEVWEPNAHGEWRPLPDAPNRTSCGYEGAELAGGVTSPAGKADETAVSLNYFVGGGWTDDDKPLTSESRVCEIRRALNRRKAADRAQPKTWAGRPEVSDARSDVLIHSVGFGKLHQSPLPHGYKEKAWRLWHRRLFVRLDAERAAGGVECKLCSQRGWEEHLHRCPSLRPLWTATESAFRAWHPRAPSPGPDALLLGLHTPAAPQAREHWLWLWGVALGVAWEVYWAAQRDEPWPLERVMWRLQRRWRELALVRWDKLGNKADPEKRARLTASEFDKGWLKLDNIGLVIRIDRGGVERLMFDRGG